MFARLLLALAFAVCLGGVLSMALDPSLSKRNAQAQPFIGQAVAPMH